MYTVEEGKGAGDIVIGGFQNGIGASPYSGLLDVKGVNISSIPGEASVAFSTLPVIKYPNTINGTATVSTTNGGLFIASNSYAIEEQMCIKFSSVPSGSGLSTGIPYKCIYYAQGIGNTQEYQLYSFPGSLVTISAAGSVTFSTFYPSAINYFQKSTNYNFAIDSNGFVWSDMVLTSGAGVIAGTNSWTYLGNQTDGTSHGNGLLVYRTIYNGTGGTSYNPPTYDEWLFVWRNSQIDYTQIMSNNSNSTISWIYGWNYALTSGTTTGHTGYLNTNPNVPNPHHAIITPDGRVNFTDGNYIGNFYQNIPAPGSTYVGFNPATGSTYTPSTITAVVQATDVGQCLSFVDQYLLVGGRQNIIYPWNMSPQNNTYSVPLILLPEKNVQSMVTVGNNCYIFAGDRGNIYVTNGSQASLFAKVPDHISNQVEPLFSWGGPTSSIGNFPQSSTYVKNRLYFGVSGTYQAQGSILSTGGVWCLDLASNAIYQAEQLSYGTWNGYVTAISSPGAAAYESYGPSVGFDLIVGWGDGNGNYGIDADTGSPSTNGSSWVTSDLIPIGLAIDPTTPTQIEFRLSRPLVSGESVQIKVGSYLDMSYASFLPCTFEGQTSFATAGAISGITDGLPGINYQLIAVQVILTSVASSPSYVRLSSFRIKNATPKLSSFFMQE